MPCPEDPQLERTDSAESDGKNSGETQYEKLMYSLHHDPKWSQEVNLGRRVGLYKFRCKLGCGNFSQVKLAIHQLTKERVAIKIVDKGMLDDKMMRMLNQEISTMESMHHPNLIRLYEVMETYSKLFLVMEYASGGELYNKVTTMGKFEEVVARNLFAQICSAVSHMPSGKSNLCRNLCLASARTFVTTYFDSNQKPVYLQHDLHIIHRDIKAENVFFSSPNKVKLGDFGFSAQLTEGSNQKLNTFCGSPPYAAPELFCDENYIGGPVDIWALGILLYFMVVGRMPFKGQNVPTLKTNILAGVYNVPSYLSKECADLIEAILQQNPLNRLTITSILSSDWLKGISLPSPSDPSETYILAPTIKHCSPCEGGSAITPYSTIEQTARERLDDLGITGQVLEAQHSQGSRSHIIGAYRIVVHRVQKQLSSFLDVDGCLSQTVSETFPPEKKKSEKSGGKSDGKFFVRSFLNKETSREDAFLNCWRRKASSDEIYSLAQSKDSTVEAKQTDRLADTGEKSKFPLFQPRTSHSAKGNVSEDRVDSSVVRSTTCSIL
ncbi:hypothetical protein RUM44_001642 [Polyplax serrata]|uniref:Protein kinase domain-containing protein n=1 Tax=Polyplax serrata TaxID=468196 RepID=A0ABR1AKM5_POLSC